jgi:hypothetical protein
VSKSCHRKDLLQTAPSIGPAVAWTLFVDLPEFGALARRHAEARLRGDTRKRLVALYAIARDRVAWQA